jgi:RHS repeat-associated protein
MFSLNPTSQDIFQARIFEEPLVPVGADPTPAENAAFADALVGYSKRSGPDDFSSLTEFLQGHPTSAWSASCLTNLGLEYYNTGHYSKTLDVWIKAWELAGEATDLKGKAVADRAVGELAYMYARLGRMTELDALLESVKYRVFSGPATERISGARFGLATMKTRPEIAFRCGPLALHRIKLAVDPQNPGTELIHAAESTPDGLSLCEVAELSCRLGLHFQMAFRNKGAAFVVPSVVHLKLDHFTAIVRQKGNHYLLQDPTFRKDVWVTQEALEDEASGYFLIPHGMLATGWQTVGSHEGETVRGKGQVDGPDPKPHGPCDPHTQGGNSCNKDSDDCKGLAVPRVHLLMVSLNINDEPVGYAPPVGPAVRFTVRYNQRDGNQPSTLFNYSNFGPKWTFDWFSYITGKPPSDPGPTSDVEYYIMGGGIRTFTGFDDTTQRYAVQQLDQTLLTKTSPDRYEMLSRDGSLKIFGQSDGAAGSSRKVFLKEVKDPFGNTITLDYDVDVELRLKTITDAIGQVTTISYEHRTDIYKITKVTDPFGRTAAFEYDRANPNQLINIIDVMGFSSQFTYDGDFITSLTTPYGTTRFTKEESGTMRSLETIYPDGNRDRVEFNQSGALGIPDSDPAQSVPTGMATRNKFLFYRNTYYWSKIACAGAYKDYTKAKIYHWLHMPDVHSAAGVLESIKEPLEGRVWYDYAGQSTSDGPLIVGITNQPAHIGRVLDDSSTQLYTYEYNELGNVTKTIDPVGRTFSYIYAENGIDLLETRQTRAGQNELLSKVTYNAQHLPLTSKDAAGQTTTYTYNARGQMLTATTAKNETTTYHYDANGYLRSIDGPLPGADDTTSFTHDSFGRVRTKTDESGYTLAFDYDALDRLTKITFPDLSFDELTYTGLDRTMVRDRAGRQTIFQYNNVRQMIKRTDPLNRTTLFQWCKCGDLKGMTDPMGRTTTWGHDVQGRVTHKKYVDGSKVSYLYETATGRLRQKIDENLQVTQYDYHRENSLSRKSYTNASVATPAVVFSYDLSYTRVTSMTDGTGTTEYGYVPVTVPPSLGATQPASVRGVLPADTITFGYDELGRRVSTAINETSSIVTLDAATRVTSVTNALGTFKYSYDGSSLRETSQTCPNGQTTERSYDSNAQDRGLLRITHKAGITPISEFIYDHDISTGRISSWSQQLGPGGPSVFDFSYDAADQLISAAVSHGGSVVNTLSYSYDSAANRSSEQIDGTLASFVYNALNQLTSAAVSGDATTFQWDAEHRLVSVDSAGKTTQFTYDGLGRCVGCRQIVDGSEISNRRFLWCDAEICEERTSAGAASKRFFAQGVRVETEGARGDYFYTRDHLGSVREVTDSSGSVRARYSYDPFGRRTRLSGDLDSDFGFAGMFWSSNASLNLTRFRAYDPVVGRWLSRDPLENAEFEQGCNLYFYVGNDPVNETDPSGLSLCRLQGCGPMQSSEPDPQCLQRADVDRTRCILESSALDPGDYRNARVNKCDRDYLIAVAACPRICVLDLH